MSSHNLFTTRLILADHHVQVTNHANRGNQRTFLTRVKQITAKTVNIYFNKRYYRNTLQHVCPSPLPLFQAWCKSEGCQL